MKHFAFFALFCLLFCACSENTQKPKEEENQAHLMLMSSNATPAQHLADKPKDKPLRIVTSSGDNLCYIPTFSAGAAHSSYIGILNCAVEEAYAARYDVFGRIAFNINDNWLCLTAPYAVAIEKTKDKDYLYLSPCVINADLQQWVIKDGVFYSHDGTYSIKDDGSYLYAAHQFAGGLSEHKLHSSMNEWANTKATPAGINLILTLAWDLEHKDGMQTYFLHNNSSDKNTHVLFHNPVSGHIAEYDELSGTYNCMYSNTGSQNWDWVTWGLCTDATPPPNNRAFFKFIPISENNYVLEDKDGNVLRLTRYGTHWGVPYVASKKYIPTDTTNSPTSSFRTSSYMQLWLRFVDANIGKNLNYCPAPGYKGNQAQNNKADSHLNTLHSPTPNVKPSVKTPVLLAPNNQNPALPLDFNFSEEWATRLYNINVSSGEDDEAVGVCGTCLLQSFQMIAELLENPYTPLTQGGYFFDTAPDESPYPSFRARNSMLHDTLADIMRYYTLSVVQTNNFFVLAIDRTIASAISLLPQYDWNLWGRSTVRAEMENLMDRLINAPVGSMFLLGLARYDNTDRTNTGHAMIAFRIQNGLIAVPANAPLLSMSSFVSRLAALTDREQLEFMLTRFGARNLRLTGLGVIEVRRPVLSNPYEGLISFRDCSGDGEDRRGNGLLPLPELINQCISGFCEW